MTAARKEAHARARALLEEPLATEALLEELADSGARQVRARQKVDALERAAELALESGESSARFVRLARLIYWSAKRQRRGRP